MVTDFNPVDATEMVTLKVPSKKDMKCKGDFAR